MANTLQTRLRGLISTNTIEVITKEFRDTVVDNNGLSIISRGFILQDLLEELTKKNDEIIIAEHCSSIDLYTTLYIVEYAGGSSRTIETVKKHLIYYEEKNRHLITDSVYRNIYGLLDQYSESYELEFSFYVHERYRFTVKKINDIAYVEVEDFHDEPIFTNEHVYVNKPLATQRIVDKGLIPALNLGAVGQKLKKAEYNKIRSN